MSLVYPSRHGREVAALDDVSLSFKPGTSTAIVGRSGSGKSTLVGVLSLMRTPTAGVLEVGGQPVNGLGRRAVASLRARTVGVVFQSFHLDRRWSAANNVLLPWTFGPGIPRRAATRRADELLECVGLGGLQHRKPSELSGGQRQRVAIARALMNSPALFIADEPTGNLDEDTAGEICDLIFRLPAETGAAVVVVTHDRQVAQRAERTVRLARGRVAEDDER